MGSNVKIVKEFLHMKHGDEESSYANNTLIQSAAACRAKHVIEKAINDSLSDVVATDNPPVRVADLGCGVGPVPLAFISTVIETVHKKSQSNQVPEIQICLNDLVSNDFNHLLRDVAQFQVMQEHHERDERKLPSYFVICVPGSFYDRLFPRNTLHFVHANHSLHWLSQVPPGLYDEHGSPLNKRNINISGTTPAAAVKAYQAQFQKDWTMFLCNRSLEMMPHGRAVLVVADGSPNNQNVYLNLLCQAIISLVSKGVIEEEKLDRFEFPAYCPSKEEMQEVVQKQGSFEVEHMDTIVDYTAQDIEDRYEKAQLIAKCIRAFSEPVVSQHFGEQVLGALYNELQRVIVEYLASTGALDCRSLFVVLKRCKCSSDYLENNVI